ncbi:MurNAc alpha-1-phosphate uridylyltransferase [Aliiroseovarius sediminilitoris]|uniref:MurNAc alpha-1-phosphate uridylyltransferase n=1 Tax=Aliiroseovarius sediminilitoris TaxID=1173584 RepID=A0A1I0MTF7_9RHOB|nr:nucleotidyltransferase family protein [Aliiroseovarius sediminilitoris]SEV91993.1 MurNAc alpha-1-phosphate uridylyltransferase [Aliiroseovarius sediminilitoris]
MPDTAMIFAAGRGTRMGALTQTIPKPMIPVAGKPLIDHALALVDDSPIRNIIINLHHLGDQIVDHLDLRDIRFSHEDSQLLETGGGLKKALSSLKSESIVTLNSDAVWTGPNPIPPLLKTWDPGRMDALLMLVAPQNAVGHTGQGDFLMAEDGLLRRGAGLTFTGCQIIKTEPVAAVGDDVFSLNVVWDRLLAGGRVFGLEHQGRWCDVGHPEGITLAETMLKDANVRPI